MSSTFAELTALKAIIASLEAKLATELSAAQQSEDAVLADNVSSESSDEMPSLVSPAESLAMPVAEPADELTDAEVDLLFRISSGDIDGIPEDVIAAVKAKADETLGEQFSLLTAAEIIASETPKATPEQTVSSSDSSEESTNDSSDESAAPEITSDSASDSSSEESSEETPEPPAAPADELTPEELAQLINVTEGLPITDEDALMRALEKSSHTIEMKYPETITETTAIEIFDTPLDKIYGALSELTTLPEIGSPPAEPPKPATVEVGPSNVNVRVGSGSTPVACINMQIPTSAGTILFTLTTF